MYLQYVIGHKRANTFANYRNNRTEEKDFEMMAKFYKKEYFSKMIRKWILSRDFSSKGGNHLIVFEKLERRPLLSYLYSCRSCEE